MASVQCVQRTFSYSGTFFCIERNHFFLYKDVVRCPHAYGRKRIINIWPTDYLNFIFDCQLIDFLN